MFKVGDKVSPAVPCRVNRGVIVGIDSGSYHATVNGRAVYFVRWDGRTTGGGWCAEDLKPAR